MKWYLKPIWIVLAILVAGPFALPLVWMTPALKKWQKYLITLIIFILTIWFIEISIELFRIVLKSFQEIQGI